MNLQNNALETVTKLNEFKNANEEFTLTELKNYLRSIKMKGVNGITLNLLKTSNICLKQNKSVVKIVKAVLQISEFGRLQLIFRLHHIV